MRELNEKELSQVSGGKITRVVENPGGQTPAGQQDADELPNNKWDAENQNPSGHAPAGQNK
jgi:bacteriocin-like protein